jgi:epoxyqueuosine reductase
MNQRERLALSAQIISKAKEFGATMVGIASVEALKRAPSFTVAPQMPEYSGVGAREEKKHAVKAGEVVWPEGARSVVVIAYAHPEEQPELDHWHGQLNPPGNKKLIATLNALRDWLKETASLSGVNLPYHVEKGGIFLKDAAVLAGLGCLGKNNLLLTPEYGSRVRLRALALDVELPPTGPLAFDPCAACDGYCRQACPQNSFAEVLYSEAEYGRAELPGRSGDYSRVACNQQMKIDEESAALCSVDGTETVKITKYCRCCEFACPVGRGR